LTTLAVLARSDAFSTLWPELASELGMPLRCAATAGELGEPRGLLALLLNVAGREEDAEPLLRSLRAEGFSRPIVIGARVDHRLALSLMHAGAGDYFALPGDLEALRAHLREGRQREETRTAREELAKAERAAFDFSRIVGRSPQLRTALDRASRIIPRAYATVLLTGETGTGKELLAQAIHYNGPRGSAPFVEVNCAAIPANLLESELFGHEKGAFTDARTAKPGLFEAASGGTLFLDEIGHLPYELQGKILKAIEEKKVRRVGAVAIREVDLRVIAATHLELAEAVRRGEFREDLYYRLSIIPIHLPPLRDRGEDVVLLAEHFLQSLAGLYDMPVPRLTPELRRILLSHTWPGNVRELRNALERGLLLGEGELAVTDLFPDGNGTPSGRGVLPFPAPLAEIERAAARSMVELLEGNKKAAADALGISRSRLYRLLEGEV
jgi:two-component system response regulator HydG